MQKSSCHYPVEIAEDVFGESSDALANIVRTVAESKSPRVALVADLNVVQHTVELGTKIGRYFQRQGIALAGNPIVLPGGEKLKDVANGHASRVASALLAAQLSSHDCVIALGGGSLLDVAGHAAVQVRGGAPILRLPTTPAAMVDAAFAGSAALDLDGIKDALRVPCEPAAVVIDPAFAETVLDGVWRSGLAAVVRHAVARDAAVLKKVEKNGEKYRARDGAAFREILSAAVASRQKKGATTFGEWLALRMESLSGYKMPHGYAISVGIYADLDYAVATGLLKAADRDFVRRILSCCDSLEVFDYSRHLLEQGDRLLQGLDAWTLAHGPGIELVAGIGKAGIVEKIDRETYRTLFQSYLARTDGKKAKEGAASSSAGSPA